MKQNNTLQNLEEYKSENILKKRLLKSVSTSAAIAATQNGVQHNVVMNNLRAPITNGMIMSTVQAPQNSMPVAHNLVTHSLAPVKIHASGTQYPIQLSTVHVPVQIPGSTSNINVPVQLTGTTSSMPLQLATPTLPIQVSGTSGVPMQLSGESVTVPLQIPANQNIQLSAALPSMPILQNSSGQIFHVHMGSNQTTGMETAQESNPAGMQVKLNPQTTATPVQMGANSMVQMTTTQNNPILIPNSASGTVLRANARSVPHMVYIQTPTGRLKPVSSSEVITQTSVSGNPPQIIVRRPITTPSNILISNKNIAPKIAPHNKSILAPANAAQPIVIQKPKSADKVMVPVTLSGPTGKQAIAYLGSVKKPNNAKISDNQSILLNNQTNANTNPNQKLFLTPMNVPKIQNTKFILPVSLPATMASKGPIINLQIANGQIQNDSQGSITVMRDAATVDTTEMPPLQPLAKVTNGKDSKTESNPGQQQNSKADKSFATSIPGSRAEATGEQEYTLSIPETNAAMNDDIYTVSIADNEGGQTREKSFTLTIPEKSKSLLNKNLIDKNEQTSNVIPAPAILRRSYSDQSERKSAANNNLKRRISLCNESLNKSTKISLIPSNKEKVIVEPIEESRVPSLFCDEKLDRDLEIKATLVESDPEEKQDSYTEQEIIRAKRESVDSAIDEDPPGLCWNNGVATLHGSNLQFQTNEFGLIDVIDHSDNEEQFMLNRAAKYHTPLKQRMERSGREKKPTSPEDLYRCDGCGCHGMAAEFVTPNFCSLTCQSEVQKTLQKKRDKERADLNRKRNKIKRLLLQKHLSDPDFQQDKDDKVSLQQFNSLPSDGRISEASLIKMNEEMENEKYPWMCGKNGFSWMRYLEYCKAKPAPVKLFKDPFPYNRNGFKVGMRMEAIDPQCASMFCVVSVAEVQGYRLRLTFDGYGAQHDYWVNADSCDVFPAGWCERHGRALTPPPGMEPALFQWPLYLKQVRAVAAPRHLFHHVTNTLPKPNGFRIGMKLEAEDRKNNMVCAATVADMMENRLLITFDSWDEMYDFWAEPSSPHIHPVGWAEENDIALTPPNFYKNSSSFSWERYLSETGATAAPARAFKTRPPQGFRPGMKLELVDRRVPFLIRVSTISEVKDYQVRVSFDGWPDTFSCWLDDDCPDLHPVGWCLKTGHPLEPPLTAEELSLCGPCGTPGCRGLGAVGAGSTPTTGSGHSGVKQHSTRAHCPYATREPVSPPPRLLRPVRSIKSTSTPTSDIVREKLPRGRPPKHKRIEEVTKTEPVSEDESVSSVSKRSRRSIRASARSVEASVLAQGEATTNTASTSHTPDVDKYITELQLPMDPTLWTESEVNRFATAICGASAWHSATEAKLSGRTLLATSRSELVRDAALRLGPAVKLHAAVRALRTLYTTHRNNTTH